MDNAPATQDGYPRELAEEARRMALHIATILGDLTEEIVIVGGLVPYLIVDQARAPEGHVGTRDVDLGLSIGVLSEERYREISGRLRERGFLPTLSEEGNRRRQTWHLPGELITVDFLIGRTPDGPEPGRLQNLESDFAAFVIDGLPLAFIDRLTVTIDGETSTGERAKRDVYVAGPAAFIVLKALAFRSRGTNKDAYDLVYVLMNYGGAPYVDVAERFARIAEAPKALEACTILAEDFATEQHLGPKRRAMFLGDVDDADLCQDAVGAVQGFLHAVGRHAKPR